MRPRKNHFIAHATQVVVMRAHDDVLVGMLRALNHETDILGMLGEKFVFKIKGNGLGIIRDFIH